MVSLFLGYIYGGEHEHRVSAPCHLLLGSTGVGMILPTLMFNTWKKVKQYYFGMEFIASKMSEAQLDTKVSIQWIWMQKSGTNHCSQTLFPQIELDV
jgi:hypothetical protein